MRGRQDLIVYIGLSATGPAEAHELRLLGNRVLLIAPRARQAQVSVGYRNFDLGYQSAVTAFASSLRLPAARASALADALTTARISSRDALGQLAKIWASAEQTNTLPGRMGLSGEHAGRLFWSKHGGGQLSAMDVKGLAAVFPTAAGGVEDLYLSACNTAYDMMDWPDVFPNLKTMWGYFRTAPSLSTGAGPHIRLWDRSTRASQQRIDRLVAKNTGRGGNVAVWSRFTGIQTGVVEAMETILARLTGAEDVFHQRRRHSSPPNRSNEKSTNNAI